MASFLGCNPQETLLWALSDLEENDFKKLKFYLRDITPTVGQPRLTRGVLEGLNPVDLASRLTSVYGTQEAVKVVIKGLKAMNLLELVDQLSHICLNDYREIYREHVRCLEEKREAGVNGCYNQLLLEATSSSGSSGSPADPVQVQELDFGQVDTLFGPEEQLDPAPSIVVLQGSAGTGKTTLVRKMLLDWAAGTLYPGRFDYVFYVSCRELFLLTECNLHRLLFWCCGDNKAPVTEILRQPERLLFILDGFDELQRPSEGQLQKWKSSRTENVLHLLIRRRLLPTCSLLITTRSPALRNLESMLGQWRCVRILGFSEEERRKYFHFYFMDEEQGRNAFASVQENAVLLEACQVPGICWMVCSWLKRQMERGQTISEKLSNSTDIFMAYVSTFLSTDYNGGCSELTRHRVLRSLCSLAAEGFQHQKFLFEEADLRRHNLDGPSLAAFLNCDDYQEGLDIKKFYSFCHTSFQEFFYAMSFLVKEDQRQLRKETKREVERLVDIKKEEKYEEITLSMQFLLDILKTESSLNLGLKVHFKISPSVMEDLKTFKEQMESIKYRRSWNLEFSLYNMKIKKLTKGIQMNDISFNIGQSNEKKSCKRKPFVVKTELNRGQKETQKCPLLCKSNEAGSQIEASEGKGRETREADKEVGNSMLGSREKGSAEMKIRRMVKWGDSKMEKNGELKRMEG